MLPNAYISNPFGLFRLSLGILRRNLKTLILGLLLVVLIVSVVLAVALIAISFANFYDSAATSATAHIVFGTAVVLGIAALLALTVFFSPFLTVVLLRSVEGKTIDVRAALAGCRANYWQILRVNFLTTLAVIGGFILLIIPGIIFAVWFSLASYIVIDQQVDAVEAMKRSKALVRGRIWEMMGVFALPAFFEFFSLIPILGPFVVLIINLLYTGAPVARYVQLKAARAQDNTPMPAVEPINYAVVIAACLVFVLVAVIRTNEMPAAHTTIHKSYGYHMTY
jgi:hypothetical protein